LLTAPQLTDFQRSVDYQRFLGGECFPTHGLGLTVDKRASVGAQMTFLTVSDLRVRFSGFLELVNWFPLAGIGRPEKFRLGRV
jgi:hypothetical protein